jgi:hypothetical protein
MSGPNGEDPRGTMSISVLNPTSSSTFSASVDCVRVIENAALVTGTLETPPPPFLPEVDRMAVYIEDRSALGLPDLIGFFFFSSGVFPHGCQELAFDFGRLISIPLHTGNFVVRDN